MRVWALLIFAYAQFPQRQRRSCWMLWPSKTLPPFQYQGIIHHCTRALYYAFRICFDHQSSHLTQNKKSYDSALIIFSLSWLVLQRLKKGARTWHGLYSIRQVLSHQDKNFKVGTRTQKFLSNLANFRDIPSKRPMIHLQLPPVITRAPFVSITDETWKSKRVSLPQRNSPSTFLYSRRRYRLCESLVKSGRAGWMSRGGA